MLIMTLTVKNVDLGLHYGDVSSDHEAEPRKWTISILDIIQILDVKIIFG